MRLDRLTFTALGGIAVFLIGTALLLEDGRALFAPVFGMVGGIAAVASANHERLQGACRGARKAAGAAGMAQRDQGSVEPLKQPRSGYDLALRTADQARTDFAALGDDLEFIMSQLAQLPKPKDLGWVALASFLGGVAFATCVNLIFWH